MKDDLELEDILAEIGREHRTVGAPRALEAVLCAAAENRQMPAQRSIGRGWQTRWALAAAAILLAAIATGAILWQARKMQQPQTQQAQRPSAPALTQPLLASSIPSPKQREIQSTSSTPRRTVKGHVNGAESSPKHATWNALDEFVPLPASEGLPAATELSVVRMRLRGNDLQQYGLQPPADAAARTMMAEFVVGEDGLPRAIRIVR